jgi:hypothetical protein
LSQTDLTYSKLHFSNPAEPFNQHLAKGRSDESIMEANGLEKFLPKSIAAKRRRKKQGSIAETTSSTDEVHEAGSGSGGADGADGAAGGGEGGAASSASSTSRGRSIISREQTADTSTRNNLEKSASNMTDGGEETSLVSYDSDPEL